MTNTPLKKQPYKFFSITHLAVTMFGLGRIKYMPGTIASLVTTAYFYMFILIGDLNFLEHYFYLLIVTAAAFPFTSSYINKTGVKDPKEVVIDEYCGQYLALLISTQFYFSFFSNTDYVLVLVIFAFIFFRVFDIVKPSYIGYCDKNYSGALGVMLDDLVAGVAAGFTTIFAMSLLHLV